MRFSSGLSVPEGPVALPDGSWLVVEMGADRGCVTHISSDGDKKRVVAKTGRPNGLAVDKNGSIWCAESDNPALLRLTLDGQVETVFTRCGDQEFLFPNDLAFGPDGKLYLTDSGIRFEDFAPGGAIRPDYLEAPIDGRVYVIDAERQNISCLDNGIRFTNGIAFDAGGDLYVNETITGNVFRYRRLDGGYGSRELFGNVNSDDPVDGLKGPDGMKFGADGRLYVTVFNQGDVTVLEPDGSVARRIRLEGSLPTNLAFGLPGDQRIYVTEVENGAIESVEVGCSGLQLHDGGRASN